MGCSASSEIANGSSVASSKTVVDIDALVSAISKGHIVPITYMLKRNPALLTQSQVFPGDQSLWHLACRHGHLGVLEAAMGLMWVLLPDQEGKLLAEGDMPPERIHPVINTVINTFDKLGNTPLALACSEHKPEIVTFLLWQGADPWMRTGNSLGLTPLHMAAIANASDSLDILLSHPSSKLTRPASPTSNKKIKLADVPSKWGFTALHCAAANHNLDALVVLLKHGASINANTWDSSGELRDWMNCTKGSTPLHVAVYAGHRDVIVTLLLHYERELKIQDITDPRLVEDKDGLRPYQVLDKSNADKASLPELARMLQPSTTMAKAMEPYQDTVLDMPSVSIMAFPRPVTRQTGRARNDDSDKCSTARDSDTPNDSNTERSSGTPRTFERDTGSPNIHITSSFLTHPTTGPQDSRLSRTNNNNNSNKELPLGATSKSGQQGRKSHSGVHFGDAEEPSSQSAMSGGSRFLRKTASDIGMRASTPATGRMLGSSGRYPSSGNGFARAGNAHLGISSAAAEWGGVMEEGQEEGITESGDSYGLDESDNQIRNAVQNQANGGAGGSNLPSPSSNGLSGRGTPARSGRGAIPSPTGTALGPPAPLRPFFATPATTPGGTQATTSSFKSLFVSDDMSMMFPGIGGGADGRGVGVGGASPTGIQSPKNAFASHGRLPSHSFGNSTIRGKPSGFGLANGGVLGTSEDGSSESREATPKASVGAGAGRVGSLPPLVNPIQRTAGSKGSPGSTLASHSSFKLIIQEAERQAQEAKYLALEDQEVEDALQAANRPPSPPIPQQIPSPGRLSNVIGPGNKGLAAHSSFKLLIREAERQAQEAKYHVIDEAAAAQAVSLKPNAWGGNMDLPAKHFGSERLLGQHEMIKFLHQGKLSPTLSRPPNPLASRSSNNLNVGMRTSHGAIHPDRTAAGTTDYSPNPQQNTTSELSPMRRSIRSMAGIQPQLSAKPVHALVVKTQVIKPSNDYESDRNEEAVTAFDVDVSESSAFMNSRFQRQSSNPGTPSEASNMRLMRGGQQHPSFNAPLSSSSQQDLPIMYDTTPQKLRSNQRPHLMMRPNRDRDQVEQPGQQRMGRASESGLSSNLLGATKLSAQRPKVLTLHRESSDEEVIMESWGSAARQMPAIRNRAYA